MSTVLDTTFPKRSNDMNVGDRVFLAFVNAHGGEIKGHAHEKEIAAVYCGRPVLEYHVSQDGSRLTDEPGQSMMSGRYFQTEIAARRWLAEEMRRIGRDQAEMAEAAAVEQEQLAGAIETTARGVVTI